MHQLVITLSESSLENLKKVFGCDSDAQLIEAIEGALKLFERPEVALMARQLAKRL